MCFGGFVCEHAQRKVLRTARASGGSRRFFGGSGGSWRFRRLAVLSGGSGGSWRFLRAVAVLVGSWRVQALGQSETLVHYDATIDFNTWVPAFLLARGTEHFLPKITGNMTDRGGPCAKPQAGVPQL